MKIVTFVARRLVGMLAILLVVSFLVFSLLSPCARYWRRCLRSDFLEHL